ncbi:hypothetical protein QNH48_10505 [Neobacillus sp. YX16]|uniref:hypothetical protein n=1 Tax=Neobacillus sp. YX16 TaxID=3047874 RepID=UPI0024C32877|nr:hypothetical protein [Neobacillus sp. YX16]WHZ05010.1 hypothetical protein QNH48_10505 [Neobacillus sp. YX16]
MAAKKENFNESLKETKTGKRKQEADETVEKVNELILEGKHGEETTDDGEMEGSLSSLDLLWTYAFQELDQWEKCADRRDEVLLKEVKHFSESVERNQGNIKAVADQFTMEFTEWEKTARDEFLMSTTLLQQFFPNRSYEEINAQFDQIQNSVLSLLSTPCQTIGNCQSVVNYEHYMELRKKGRLQLLNTIKQAGNPLYEYQKGFVNQFATQFKDLIFPLNKYMEETEETTKS